MNHNYYDVDPSNHADPPEQDVRTRFTSTSNRGWKNIMSNASVGSDSGIGSSLGSIHQNARDRITASTPTLNTFFSKQQRQPPAPNHIPEDASGVFSSYSKEDASGIYASYSSKSRGREPSVSSSLGAAPLEKTESSPGGSKRYHHFHQRARNSAEAHITPSNGGQGAHPKDMRNHPKRGVKKDKDSDLDVGGGSVDQANRVKFADQIFTTQSQPRTVEHPASSWKGRNVSSAASIGSGCGSILEEGSMVSNSSIDSSRAGDSFNIAAMWHRRKKYLNLKKRAAVLLVVAVLVLVGISRRVTGGKAARSRRDMVGFAEEQHRFPKQADALSMLQQPTAGGGGLGTDGVMDLTKVPPHLRGYYAKMMGAGQPAPHSAAEEKEQLHQLQLKNEMIQIQNQIMGAQAKTIETMAIPAVNAEEFQRQQEELERIDRTGSGGGDAGEVQGQQQRGQEEEAEAARAVEEAGQRNMELSGAELEAARQKTKDQLAASRQKAAEEEMQRIALEEEARQKMAEEEGLRKAAGAEEEQRIMRKQAVQKKVQEKVQKKVQEKAKQKEAEREQVEEPPKPEQLQKEMEDLLVYLNEKGKR